MEDQLDYCKLAILFFDKIEEKRPLDKREFGLRQKIREPAYELSNNVEISWHQRSRCNWLQNGDNNTRFFHAYASARARKNTILSLEVNEVTISDQGAIREAFLQHMRAMLGERSQSLDFDPTILYPEQQVDLTQLKQQQFSITEVQMAVRQLTNNKASGPDGLPHEFFKSYWDFLKGDIMQVFEDFFQHVGSVPHQQGKYSYDPQKGKCCNNGRF